MTTAAYLRVSTTEQTEASQRREIERWLAGHGLEAVWYCDKATGDNLARPDFEQLQADVFSGSIKTVVVWKLDRLSRSLKDGIAVLCDWCERGVRVVSVTQQIDFSGAVGKMMGALLLGVAEMEQETRRERQRAGIAAARERGVYKGRKPGSLKGSPQRAAALHSKGYDEADIAKLLGVSTRTVQRYLRTATPTA